MHGQALLPKLVWCACWTQPAAAVHAEETFQSLLAHIETTQMWHHRCPIICSLLHCRPCLKSWFCKACMCALHVCVCCRSTCQRGQPAESRLPRHLLCPVGTLCPLSSCFSLCQGFGLTGTCFQAQTAACLLPYCDHIPYLDQHTAPVLYKFQALPYPCMLTAAVNQPCQHDMSSFTCASHLADTDASMLNTQIPP